MNKINVKYFDKLPEFSFAYLPTNNEVIMIKRGVDGYFPQPDLQNESVNLLNERFGVSKAQGEAMLKGSMYGWDIPASNPDMWIEKLNNNETKESELFHNNNILKNK